MRFLSVYWLLDGEGGLEILVVVGGRFIKWVIDSGLLLEYKGRRVKFFCGVRGSIYFFLEFRELIFLKIFLSKKRGFNFFLLI